MMAKVDALTRAKRLQLAQIKNKFCEYNIINERLWRIVKYEEVYLKTITALVMQESN